MEIRTRKHSWQIDDGERVAKTNEGILCGTNEEKRKYVDKLIVEGWTVRKGCEVVKMSIRTFYYKRLPKSEELYQRDQNILEEIRLIIEKYSWYGYRMLKHELNRREIDAGYNKVLNLTRKNGLLHKVKRKYIVTTDSNHSFRIHPNLIKGLEVTRINQVWVGDITYVGIMRGFLYLAVILDSFSRLVIGYAISRFIDTNLTLAALRMAISRRIVVPGIIHHTDR